MEALGFPVVVGLLGGLSIPKWSQRPAAPASHWNELEVHARRPYPSAELEAAFIPEDPG